MAGKVTNWFQSHLPTRESLAANRWTRPFATHILHPALWRFTRRSVPRGVAVGLLIAPLLPVAHTVPAVLLAVPVRANVVIAGAITWVINPITMIPFYYVADLVGTTAMSADPVGLMGKIGAVALGSVMLAVVMASLGYVAASFGWKWRVARKWRRRNRVAAR